MVAAYRNRGYNEAEHLHSKPALHLPEPLGFEKSDDRLKDKLEVAKTGLLD